MLTSRLFFALLALALPATAAQAEPPLGQPGVLSAEFIYEETSFPQCHASTLAEADGAIVAAWFGGTREGHADVGIWLARRENGRWSAPVEVATGKTGEDRYPCWNPVLYQAPGGPLLLFYKVGPNPSAWWGMLIRSEDGGANWSAPERLPEGILGPIKNKPVGLADGTLLCGASSEHDGWRVYFERTADLGRTWTRGEPLATDGEIGAIQPTILCHGQRLQTLCRTRQGKIAQAWSEDGGATWTPLSLAELPNPNSGIDAVTLADGRALLVYNPTQPPAGKWGGPRTPLAVALSADGRTWRDVATLETAPGEYSYPAVIQTSDGLVHITYTWRRQRVRHVVMDAGKL